MADAKSNYEFQGIIAKFIEKMGFQVESTRILDDGSVDFRAKTTNPMGGQVYSLIRASAYNRLVNGNDVDSLNDAMKASNAIRAAYITTSGFSDDAIEAARDKPLSLINKFQLMDSIEKRGLLSDSELMESLDKLGMGEQHFQGYEQSFRNAKNEGEIKQSFLSKAKKGEKVMQIESRYAPVTVLKVVTSKEVYTEDQTLSTIEKKDYMFVNLNNLDLYYILQRRKKNATENLLMRSDILKKIHTLPPESKEHLMHLLDYGDLPIEDLQGKELSILKNKKVIDVYEGKRMKKGDLSEYVQFALDGLIETINMIVTEITTGISGMGEDSDKKKEEEKPKKKVMAEVSMPHLYGGKYDIWKFLEAEKGISYGAEIDSLTYTSTEVSSMLKSIMKGKVKSEGIIFMPYCRVKYADEKDKVLRYENMMLPKFKGQDKRAKESEAKGPKIEVKRKAPSSPYRIIR